MTRWKRKPSLRMSDGRELKMIQRKIKYPHGRVIHYAKDINGFQKIQLLCGRIVERSEVKESFDNWGGMTRYCHNCLMKRNTGMV